MKYSMIVYYFLIHPYFVSPFIFLPLCPYVFVSLIKPSSHFLSFLPWDYFRSPAVHLSIVLTQWSFFTFQCSVVTPGYILTSENLQLRTSDEREYVTYVFLGLCHLTQYTLFQFHYLPTSFMIFFFFVAKQYLIMYMYHIFIIHSLAEGCLWCFHFLVLWLQVVLNMAEQVFMGKDVYSFQHMNAIAGPNGRIIFRFYFLQFLHLLHWLTCLSLCQYHIVFIIMTMKGLEW